jgi:hypothetical protein
MDIVKHAKEINNKPPIDMDKNNGIELQGGVLLASTSATAESCDNPNAPCYTMFCQPIMSCALPAVTNLLQVFVDGEESRTTSIIEGGDDEDIAKMESRTTPIQEGEDDEDIATLDMLTPSYFPSCNSSPSQLPRHSRIQQTHCQCFDHNFFIRYRWKGDIDAVVLDLVLAPDLSWINHYVHDKLLCHLFWANLVLYRIRALSPCCGCLPLVVSNSRSLLLYIPRSHRCLDLGFV